MSNITFSTVRPINSVPVESLPAMPSVAPASNTSQSSTPTPTQPTSPYVVSQGNLRGSFEYDQKLNQVIITLRNEDTGAVVQQFPPEQIISMLTRLMESQGNTIDVRG